METLPPISLALLPPVLLGILCINILIPKGADGRVALVWGNGAVLGLLLLTMLMRMVDMSGAGLSFATTNIVIVLLGSALLLFNLWVRPLGQAQPGLPLSQTERLLFFFLLALVLLRLATLGLEIYWRPLFPWDATMHWATKAKVWFDQGTMVPFVEHATWAELGGDGVFTDRHPHYPAAIPLLQVWMSLALGAWDESLINVPWLVCFGAMGLAFFGQLRLAGCGKVIAMAFTYFLMSMPLLNIHVALAGYADLFLGAAYGAAVMFFYHWCQDKATWKGVACVTFLVFCPLLKNEGVIWAATLLPAFALMVLPRPQTLKFFVLIALLAILAILVVPNNMVIAGTTLNQITPSFNGDGLSGLVKSIWVHENWHLMGYLLLAIGPIAYLLRDRIMDHYLGLLLTLATAAGAFLYLFLFTGFAWGARDLSAVGRLCLHLMPGLLFMAAVFYRDLVARSAG